MIEARASMSHLLDAVARGEHIVITRRGTPVGLLVPPPRVEAWDTGRVVEEMLRVRRRTGPRLRGLPPPPRSGPLGRPDTTIPSDLDHLFGTWTNEQADEFDGFMKDFEQIDESLWQ